MVLSYLMNESLKVHRCQTFSNAFWTVLVLLFLSRTWLICFVKGEEWESLKMRWNKSLQFFFFFLIFVWLFSYSELMLLLILNTAVLEAIRLFALERLAIQHQEKPLSQVLRILIASDVAGKPIMVVLWLCPRTSPLCAGYIIRLSEKYSSSKTDCFQVSVLNSSKGIQWNLLFSFFSLSVKNDTDIFVLNYNSGQEKPQIQNLI